MKENVFKFWVLVSALLVFTNISVWGDKYYWVDVTLKSTPIGAGTVYNSKNDTDHFHGKGPEGENPVVFTFYAVANQGYSFEGWYNHDMTSIESTEATWGKNLNGKEGEDNTVYYTYVAKFKELDCTLSNLTYRRISADIKTCKLVSASTNTISVPASVEMFNWGSYRVVEIDGNAFSNVKTSVTSITLSDNVNTIGSGAFQNCTNLASIALPTGFEIRTNEFSGCSNLTKIKYKGIWYQKDGSSWKVIKNGATYSGKINILKSLPTLSGDVTSIDEGAFKGCSGITSVSLPSSITSIGKDAFNGCSGLTAINIPDNVKTIGESAFQGCSGAKTLSLSNSITGIEKNTFNGCSGLTAITIPDNVKTIGESAFQGCSGAKTLSLSNSITGIEKNTFNGCSGLTAITIPSSVTDIKENAFSQCINIGEVYITDLVKWCAISFANNANPLYVGGWHQRKQTTERTSKECILYINGVGKTEIVIPKGVKSISKHAFEEYQELTRLDLPQDIESIKDSAFLNCGKLSKVFIMRRMPPAVYKNAFSNTATLYVRDRNAANRYRNNTEWNSYFNSGNNIKPIEENYVERKGEDGNYIFYHITDKNNKTCEVCPIPDTILKFEEKHSYEVEKKYNEAGISQLIIPEKVRDTSTNSDYDVTSIAENTFKGCTTLTSVSLPPTLTAIGGGAFEGCTKLGKLYIEDILKWGSMDIEDRTAHPANASDTVKLYVGEKETHDINITTETINKYAFYNLRCLDTVTLGSKLTSIGDSAFAYCNVLPKNKQNNSRGDSLHLAVWGKNSNPPTLGKGVFTSTFKNINQSGLDSSTWSVDPSDTKRDSAKRWEQHNNVNLYVLDDATQHRYIDYSTKTDDDNDVWKNYFNVYQLAGDGLFIPYDTLDKDSEYDSVCYLRFIVETQPSGGKPGTCYLTRRADIWDTAKDVSEKVKTGYYNYGMGMDTCTYFTIPNTVEANNNKYVVTSIGFEAFDSCMRIRKVVLPNTLNGYIGEYAFYSCDSLEDINIPAKVKRLEIGAFEDCDTLKEIVLSDSLQMIYKDAFWGCRNLTKVTFKEKLTSIGDSAFACTNIDTLELKPKNSLTIAAEAFAHCLNLKEVTLKGDGNAKIDLGAGVFFEDSSLTKLDLNDSVNFPEAYVFKNCASLDSITFPQRIRTLAMSAFEGCIGLRIIEINPQYSLAQENAYRRCQNIEQVRIKDLSQWCKIPLTSDFSNPLGTGGYYQRTTDSTWNERDTSSGVKPAGLYLYDGNTNAYSSKPLEHLIIPEDVTEVGVGAFNEYQCLKSVTIPNNVKRIATYAFCGAMNLDSVLCFSKVPANLGTDVFLYNSDDPNRHDTSHAKLYVRDRVAKERYESNDAWSRAFSYYDTTETSDKIGIKNLSDTAENKVFEYDSLFYRIIGEDSCELVRKHPILEAKEGVYHGEFVLPDKPVDSTLVDGGTALTLRSIGDSALVGSKVTLLDIPDSVSTIGLGAFVGSKDLKKIYCRNVLFPLLLESGEAPTFDNTVTNDTLYVRDKSTKGRFLGSDWGKHFEEGRIVPLGNADFYWMGIYYNLYNSEEDLVYTTYNIRGKDYTGSIYIPDSFRYANDTMYHVKAVGEKAFTANPITMVYMPSCINSIGDSAFASCSELDTIILTSYFPVLGEGAFKDVKSEATIYADNKTFMEKYEDSANWKALGLKFDYLGEYHFIKDGACYDILPDSGRVQVARSMRNDFKNDSVRILRNTYYKGNVVVLDSVVNDDEKYIKEGSEVKKYNVVGVGDSAFASSVNLKALELPRSIWAEKWGEGCFFNIHLDSLICDAQKPYENRAYHEVLFNTKNNGVLYLHDRAAQNWYTKTLGWDQHFDTIILLNACDLEWEDFFFIYNGDPAGYPADSTLTLVAGPNRYSDVIDIPNYIENTFDGGIYKITGIDSLAFRDCDGLKKLTLHKNIENIGSDAFKGCKVGTFDSLFIEDVDAWANINFGTSSGGFSNPMSITGKCQVIGSKRILTDLVLSNSSVKPYAFFGNKALDRVTLLPSVTTIGSNAFWNCTGLEEVYCLHEDYNSIPNIDRNTVSSVFSENIKKIAKLYILDEIWEGGDPSSKNPEWVKGKGWPDYFDYWNAVSIYDGGEQGGEIIPHSSKVMVSTSRGEIRVSGAKSWNVVGPDGNIIVASCADEVVGVNPGNYIVSTIDEEGNIGCTKVNVE